jgi:hypothetical protein
MLFSGAGHSTYLGCLNCNEYAGDSIFNSYSAYGSAYSATSIFNRLGQFGSAYSAYSACNRYASDPPVLVDGQGNFYGRLTLNLSRADAIRNQQVVAWLAAACSR